MRAQAATYVVAFYLEEQLLAGCCCNVIDVHLVPRSAKNVWAGMVVVVVLGAMGWLTLRGNRFNGWLLPGLAPIALAAFNRAA